MSDTETFPHEGDLIWNLQYMHFGELWCQIASGHFLLKVTSNDLVSIYSDGLHQ